MARLILVLALFITHNVSIICSERHQAKVFLEFGDSLKALMLQLKAKRMLPRPEKLSAPHKPLAIEKLAGGAPVGGMDLARRKRAVMKARRKHEAKMMEARKAAEDAVSEEESEEEDDDEDAVEEDDRKDE